jgi:hypothetical protein
MNGQHGKAKSGAREWSRKGRKNEGKALRVRAKAKLAEEAEKGLVMTEKEARAAVLQWCREAGRKMQGQPQCREVDVGGRHIIKCGLHLYCQACGCWCCCRGANVFAEGETWQECAGKLGLTV